MVSWGVIFVCIFLSHLFLLCLLYLFEACGHGVLEDSWVSGVVGGSILYFLVLVYVFLRPGVLGSWGVISFISFVFFLSFMSFLCF